MTKLNEDGFYILYGNVYPVKGYSLSALYDLQFNKIELVPNDIYTILKNGFKLQEYECYTISLSIEEVKEYIEYLLAKKLIFHTYTPELFPRISTQYTSPSIITNAVIEINTQSITVIKFDEIIGQLRKMGCKVLMIKILHEISSFEQEQITNVIVLNEIEDMTIIFPENRRREEIINNFQSKMATSTFIIHEAETTSIQENRCHKIIFTSKSLKNNHCSSVTNPKLFTVNIDFFTESFNYNICLNRKMCIDIYGNIKNCLMFDQIYGNIKKDKLMDIANNNEFQYLWHIKKDQINICKECELRYMCFDCRNNSKSTFGMPNCNYNPLIAKWKGQKGYVIVNED